MPFNDIAINDGSVAGLELRRNLVLVFYGRKVLHVFNLYVVTVVLHVSDPVATATSGRRPKYGDFRIRLLTGTGNSQKANQ
jgi:hypothetical protein